MDVWYCSKSSFIFLSGKYPSVLISLTTITGLTSIDLTRPSDVTHIRLGCRQCRMVSICSPIFTDVHVSTFLTFQFSNRFGIRSSSDVSTRSNRYWVVDGCLSWWNFTAGRKTLRSNCDSSWLDMAFIGSQSESSYLALDMMDCNSRFWSVLKPGSATNAVKVSHHHESRLDCIADVC